MKRFHKNIILSVILVLTALYLYLPAVLLKPEYIALSENIYKTKSVNENYYCDGTGIVRSLGKYAVKSARIRITVYNEENKKLASDIYTYREEIPFSFYYEFSDSPADEVIYEVIDVEYNSLWDRIIGVLIFLIGETLLIHTLFVKYKSNKKPVKLIENNNQGV